MPIKSTQSKPVTPNAVRIWRGFKLSTLTSDKFFDDLGSVFVPATVQMQWPSGLDAYIPSFPSGKAKPATVPDETAILFWDSQLVYNNGFDTLAIRTYSLTHGAVYDFTNKESAANFPKKFAGTTQAGDNFYLFDDAIDWMHGTVFHLVGARPAKVKPAAFIASINKWAIDFQKHNPDKAKGAVFCVTNDYIVFWECIPKAKKSGKGMAALAKLCTVYHNKAAKPTTIPEVSVFDNYTGMKIKPGDSLNMQFPRRNLYD